MGVLSDFCDCKNRNLGDEINLSSYEEDNYLCPFTDSSKNKKDLNDKSFGGGDMNFQNKIIKSNILNKNQINLTKSLISNVNTSYGMSINYYNNSNINSQKSSLG